MIEQGRIPSMPTAAEMASCACEPDGPQMLRKRIREHFAALRKSVQRPPKGDAILIRRYGEVMGRLRADEDASRQMLDAFVRGDAEGVREACGRLVRR